MVARRIIRVRKMTARPKLPPTLSVSTTNTLMTGRSIIVSHMLPLPQAVEANLAVPGCHDFRGLLFMSRNTTAIINANMNMSCQLKPPEDWPDAGVEVMAACSGADSTDVPFLMSKPLMYVVLPSLARTYTLLPLEARGP